VVSLEQRNQANGCEVERRSGGEDESISKDKVPNEIQPRQKVHDGLVPLHRSHNFGSVSTDFHGKLGRFDSGICNHLRHRGAQLLYNFIEFAAGRLMGGQVLTRQQN